MSELFDDENAERALKLLYKLATDQYNDEHGTNFEVTVTVTKKEC